MGLDVVVSFSFVDSVYLFLVSFVIVSLPRSLLKTRRADETSLTAPVQRLHDIEHSTSSHPLQVFLIQNFHHELATAAETTWAAPFDSTTNGPSTRLPRGALAS